MSTARGRANHGLYLARIQLDAWGQAAADSRIPAITLSQAFLPAVRAHLVQAYGWFLLAIAGEDSLPERPPARCADLPATARGKATPGEIREFGRLEAGGWLAELLAEQPLPVAGRRSAGNLAAPSYTDRADAQRWLEQLQQLFERMGDSLDEY